MTQCLPCVVQNRPSLCRSDGSSELAAASCTGTETDAAERLDRLEAQQGVLLDEMRSRFDALESSIATLATS
jgi:hypothetical protein